MNLYCRLYIVMFIKTYQRILLGNGSTWTHPQHQLWPTWQRMLAQKISKRCSCGIFSLFKSHLWFKCVLKNPREIRFFTLKRQIKSKDCDLGDQKLRAVFCCFCKDWKARKKIHSIFLDNIKPCSLLCQVGWKLRGCHCSSHCFSWISSLCLRFNVP